MDNHVLSIGMMKTDCKVAAFPHAVPPLRSRLERSVEGPLPALLAKAAEPVLHGREGVIRIRKVKLDLAHHGEWDERTLASLIASKLASALAGLLEGPADQVRFWPDYDCYMASYIEFKLGIVHEPEWAFPEFEPLRLLSAEQAAAEVIKARPSVLAVLASNGQRTGNVARIGGRLSVPMAAAIVEAWLRMPEVFGGDVLAMLADPLIVRVLLNRPGSSGGDIHRSIIMTALELSVDRPAPSIPQVLKAAILLCAVAKLQSDRSFMAVHGHSPSVAIAAMNGVDLTLPETIAGFLKRAAAAMNAPAILDQLFRHMSGKADREPLHASARKGKANTAKVHLQTIHSPFAGFALLLPDIVRHGLHRQLSQKGLRDTVLAIVPPDMRTQIEQDELLLTLFPESEETETSWPPVPEGKIALLAAESRHLINGREGADGWAGLLLASFASRLPGLRASSRGYLMRQFLQVEGKADITGDAIVVTLDSLPLAIVLKMAGLSGEQMALPFFDNRMLNLKLGGGR